MIDHCVLHYSKNHIGTGTRDLDPLYLAGAKNTNNLPS
jgi:hypothetical protein